MEPAMACHADRTAPVFQTKGLTKTYRQGDVEVHALRRSILEYHLITTTEKLWIVLHRLNFAEWNLHKTLSSLDLNRLLREIYLFNLPKIDRKKPDSDQEKDREQPVPVDQSQ